MLSILRKIAAGTTSKLTINPVHTRCETHKSGTVDKQKAGTNEIKLESTTTPTVICKRYLSKK